MARGWHYAILSIECPSSIFFWHVYFVILVPFSLSFLFVCVFLLLSLELCRCSSDLFLSSRPRTELATTLKLGMVEARMVNVKKTTDLSLNTYNKRYCTISQDYVYICT